MSCALYAKENNLLDQPGWKGFKNIAKQEKLFTPIVNQAKLCLFSTSIKYKYGCEVPRSYNHAMLLDEMNVTNIWKDAVALQ
jgi:hypothetical protein